MKAPATDVPYTPDEVLPPGETLRETLEALDLSQVQFAARTGLSAKHVNQIMQGQSALTPETALMVERVTGVPARFWNSLETNYRDALSRQSERKVLTSSFAWLDELPVTELRKRGYVSATKHDKGELVQQLLQFFGVSSEGAWRNVYRNTAVSFLQSQSLAQEPGAVAAWLRLGEIAAMSIACAPFDRTALRAAIPHLRALSLQPFPAFWPTLQELCASLGIALVLVPDVPGARASGATRWTTPNKALIQLSNRGKRNDKFWFAFFHEIGHVLLHGKKNVFFDDQDAIKWNDGSADESEANEFAATTLIPKKWETRLPDIQSAAGVESLAGRIGIAPGIVAGRLQHERNDYSLYLRLCEKYDFETGYPA